MTISASNASTAARAEGAPTAAAPPTQTTDETARTVASRFVILALCLAVVLSTLAFGAVHSWSIGLFYVGAASVLLCWAADAWRTRRLRVSLNLLQLPLAGLFLLGLAQLLPIGSNEAGAAAGALPVEPVRALSLDPHSTRVALVQIGALFVYFAAALAFIDGPRRLRAIVRTLVIFGFSLAVFSVVMSFIMPDRVLGIRQTTQAVGFGPFINRHHFAAFMEMSLALPLGLVFAGAVERERRPLYLFAAAIMGIAIILTNSRGGMVSLVAEILFLAVVSGVVRRGRGKRAEEVWTLRQLLRRAALGFVVVVALFVGVLFFGGEDALNRLVGTVNAEDPTTGRLHFWKGALGIIRDHPLVGTGLGSFSLAYSRYDTNNGVLFRLEQAHNDYLQLLSDAGVVGAALGLFFVAVLFRTGLKRMESASTFRRGVALGALSGCFAVLVHSLFDFTLHTTANALLFLLLAALATVNGRVEHQRRRARHQRRTAAGPKESEPAIEGEAAAVAGLTSGGAEREQAVS